MGLVQMGLHIDEREPRRTAPRLRNESAHPNLH